MRIWGDEGGKKPERGREAVTLDNAKGRVEPVLVVVKKHGRTT